MKKVLFGQQKGGVGKSTLAANVAVGLALRGERVIIIDTDRQQTCVKWGSRRKLANHQPVIEYATLIVGSEAIDEFVNTIKDLEDSGSFDYCLLDAGGRDNFHLRLSLCIADVLIAPSQPSQADIESLQEFAELVGEVKAGNPKIKSFVVINNASTGLFSKAIGDAKENIERMKNMTGTNAVIAHRPVNFRDNWAQGKTAYDMGTIGAKKAVAEIEEVIALI